MLLLKQETLEEFKKEISFERLTPVFKDAVSVTRRLEIRYLWIDTLCII